MATPGFPPGTLDELGDPIWITDLAAEDPNHTVHVVRDLDPADALLSLGVKPHEIRSCELPADRSDGWTSLPRAAIGPTDSGAVLLAGRIGMWTFVYDDSGFTSFGADFTPSAKILSANGREAATSTYSINADTSLAYAVDGEVLFDIGDDLDMEAYGEDVPDGLRAAVEAAGIFESDDFDEGEPDSAVNMRVVCALAQLHCTLDDLRRVPLLAAPFS